MVQLYFMSQSFLRIWHATGFDTPLSSARHPARQATSQKIGHFGDKISAK